MRPSAVSSTLRVSRSKRRVLSSLSSVRINALKAGCERWQVAAACVKLRWSARARKARSCRRERLGLAN
jgi:hypothetical protein